MIGPAYKERWKNIQKEEPCKHTHVDITLSLLLPINNMDAANLFAYNLSIA